MFMILGRYFWGYKLLRIVAAVLTKIYFGQCKGNAIYLIINAFCLVI